MSAAVGAVAAATRGRLKEQEARERAQREFKARRYREAKAELADGKMDFHKALKALQAKRAVQQALALRNRPTTDALLDPTLKPTEVVGTSSGKAYGGTGFFCLRPYHEPRRTAIMICESKPFDPLILLTILANCTTMAWESPLDPTGTWKSGFIDVSPLALCPDRPNRPERTCNRPRGVRARAHHARRALAAWTPRPTPRPRDSMTRPRVSLTNGVFGVRRCARGARAGVRVGVPVHLHV